MTGRSTTRPALPVNIMPIENAVTHFTSAFQAQIQAAAQALAGNDPGKFEGVLDSIKNSGPVQSITLRLAHSREDLDEFKADYLANLGSTGAFLGGVIIFAVGIGVLAEGAAVGAFLAAPIGATVTTGVVLAEVIGLALLCIGICKMIPSLWETIEARALNLASSILKS